RNDEKQGRLNRRQFISASTGAAAAILATGKALASSPTGQAEHGHSQEPGPAAEHGHQQGSGRARQGGHHFARPTTRVRLTSFPQPVVYRSYLGVLDATLNVAMLPGTQIRAYNGNVPGPTLMVDPGDQLKLVVANNLPPNPPPPSPSST